MSQFSWLGTSSDEYIEDMRRMEQQYLDDMLQQASNVQMAAMAQQAIGGGGSSGSNQSLHEQFSTDGSISNQEFGTPSFQYGTYSFTAPPRHPQQDAHDFSYGLNQLIPGMIKEIVLKEPLYMQMLIMEGIDPEKDPEILKEWTYSNAYGTILLKNEKFQFSLEKYMEDAPVKL